MHHLDHVTDETAVRALDGELAPRDLGAAEAHWAACDACRARRLQLFQSSLDLSASHRTGDSSPTDESRSRTRLFSTLTSLRARQTAEGPHLAAGLPWRSAALAAALVLLVLVIRTPGRERSMAADARDGLPSRALTPGATWELTAAELCDGVRATRVITPEMRAEVLREYRMENISADAYELDYLVTPELGGATDARNLWPQRYALRTWNAHVKDALETLLPQLVCSNRLSLETAQREMAEDWVAAYRKYFNTDTPLAQHALSTSRDDDDEGVLWARAEPGGPAPRIRLVSATLTVDRRLSTPRLR